MIDTAWDDIWRDLAGGVAAHRSAGRGHLLTEDAVRMEAVLALGRAGIPASRLAVEVRAPELAGGSIDLVVEPPAGAVIEFKYPRGSRTGISPDTMILGELLELVPAALTALPPTAVRAIGNALPVFTIRARCAVVARIGEDLAALCV